MATPTSLPATFVAGNVLTAAEMNGLRGAFRILQVVSTTKTDTFTTSSTSYTDLTGLSVTITPSATSSKVLLLATFGAVASSQIVKVQFERNGTPVGNGAAAGSRTPAGIFLYQDSGNRPVSASWSYLDSPSSTSALTYQTQVSIGSGTLYINRSSVDTDASNYGRTSATITVMEVSA